MQNNKKQINKTQFKKNLQKYALIIIDLFENAIQKKEIHPREVFYRKYTVEEFNYSDEGIKNYQSKTQLIKKIDWHTAIGFFTLSLKEKDVYKHLIEILCQYKSERISQKYQAISIAQDFTNKLLKKYLDSRENTNKIFFIIQTTMSTLLKELDGVPIEYYLKAKLLGVIPPINAINLDKRTLLRRVQKEDLQEEMPLWNLTPAEEFPSAVLEIKFTATNMNEPRQNLERTITILSLFEVCSIKWQSFTVLRESVINSFDKYSISSHTGPGVFANYLIRNEETEKLKKFYQIVNKNLPENFFWSHNKSTLDYKAIAYLRYTDALLHSRYMELKIANTVMGLEALYFKKGENEELKYKLALRISKIMQSLEVKFNMMKAYNIRSEFVHGGCLTQKTTEKLMSEFVSVKNFVLRISDYLRVSIIITLLFSMQKEDFLNLIDDSLIDKKRENELEKVLKTTWKKLGCYEFRKNIKLCPNTTTHNA